MEYSITEEELRESLRCWETAGTAKQYRPMKPCTSVFQTERKPKIMNFYTVKTKEEES